MDMREEVYDDEFKGKKLYFTLVESRMFNAFDGNWRVQVHSREKVLISPSPSDHILCLYEN